MRVVSRAGVVRLFHSNAPARVLCAVFGLGTVASICTLLWSLSQGREQAAAIAAGVTAACLLGVALNAFYPEVRAIFDGAARQVSVRSRLPLAMRSPSERKIPFREINEILRRRDGGEIDNVFVSLRLNTGETIALGEGTFAQTHTLADADRMLRAPA